MALPLDISAAANPKSSTGRLDVFTRVIADQTRGFDRIEAGYHGPLYAEISPRTFPVLLREGSRLSQIRFRRGHAMLSPDALVALHAQESLVDDGLGSGKPGRRRRRRQHGLRRPRRQGERHTGLIDVDRRGGYEVAEFWEAIAPRRDKNCRARPRTSSTSSPPRPVQVPPDYAADGAVRSTGRRVPRALCGLLRSRLRLCGRRRAHAPCWKCARARCRSSSSTARRSAPPRLREDAGAADQLYGQNIARTTRRRASSCRSISRHRSPRRRRRPLGDCAAPGGMQPSGAGARGRAFHCMRMITAGYLYSHCCLPAVRPAQWSGARSETSDASPSSRRSATGFTVKKLGMTIFNNDERDFPIDA